MMRISNVSIESLAKVKTFSPAIPVVVGKIDLPTTQTQTQTKQTAFFDEILNKCGTVASILVESKRFLSSQDDKKIGVQRLKMYFKSSKNPLIKGKDFFEFFKNEYVITKHFK